MFFFFFFFFAMFTDFLYPALREMRYRDCVINSDKIVIIGQLCC